jgi:glycosyltransferase involved in cell wall biosynthesis
MKVALVHDHLIQDGGAEKVLQVMQDIWPEAPTFTLFFDPDSLPAFRGRNIKTSFLQNLPFALKRYQWYIGLMPAATESHDLSAFDVVISSSSAFSKGVITRPDALHICYCHTPTRYLWSDTHSYVQELRVPKIVKTALPPLLSKLRLWDQAAANRVDYFLANSETVRERIQKYYQRESTVVHPPVDVTKFSISDELKTHFLVGGRLVAYKRYDLVVEAFNRTGLPLKIFGSGPVEKDLREKANENIEFLGRVNDETRRQLFAACKAFIHPHEEDFGLTAVEAMASGRPVIAYRRGGATETVVDQVTGEFFDEQSWEELADHLIRFDESRYNSNAIRAHAERFSEERFKNELRSFVERAWEEKQRHR